MKLVTLLATSVRLGLQIDGGIFATTINLNIKIETITFIEVCQASSFYSADMYESIGLTIVTLNKAEAFHCVEEFDRTAGMFAGELALWAAAKPAFAWFAWAFNNWQRFTFNFQVSGGNFAATVYQSETKRLSFSKAGKARLLYSADMYENIFFTIVTDNKAEAFLPVEEFYDTGAFADNLCRHTAAATTASAAAKSAATTAEPATVATATVAKTTAITEAAAAITKTATIAEPAAAITKATALFWETTKIVAAETVALVPAASAATSIKTHALLVTFASSQNYSDEHVGRRTCKIRRIIIIRSENHYKQVYTRARLFFFLGVRVVGKLIMLWFGQSRVQSIYRW